MGRVSIGVVPMGVINASMVGMGILIARVNVVDVWWWWVGGGMDSISSTEGNGGRFIIMIGVK